MKDSQITPYEHSDIKVKLLQLYLEKYISVLSLANKIKEVEVYDLFCGEGIYENGKTGSPVIILNLLNEIHNTNKQNGKSTVNFNCYFNDIDKRKIDKLSAYIESKNIHQSEYGALTYKNEDYQKVKSELILNPCKDGTKSFFFIDPYGYKDISLKDIEGLLADGNTEVLLFLPTQFMYRFEKEATPECLYDFLTEVFPLDEQKTSSSGIDFINKLRDGFGSKLADKHYVDSFIITRDANQYFALFFFTSHLYGFEKFLEAKWQIDEEEGRGWSPPVKYQLPLFAEIEAKPNTDKFEKKLISYLEESRSNIEIHKFTIQNRHLISHSVQILKNLQEKGELSVIMLDGKEARKSSFYIGWNEVKSTTEKCHIKIKDHGTSSLKWSE